MNNWKKWVTETRPDVLYSKYKNRLIDSGFTVCGECSKMFSPFGYTCVFLLAESHFAIHTFPEEGKTYLELTSCVDEPFYRFVEGAG